MTTSKGQREVDLWVVRGTRGKFPSGPEYLQVWTADPGPCETWSDQWPSIMDCPAATCLLDDLCAEEFELALGFLPAEGGRRRIRVCIAEKDEA